MLTGVPMRLTKIAAWDVVVINFPRALGCAEKVDGYAIVITSFVGPAEESCARAGIETRRAEASG